MADEQVKRAQVFVVYGVGSEPAARAREWPSSAAQLLFSRLKGGR